MICPTCGNVLPDGAAFCTECGNAVPAAPAPQQPQQTQQQQPQPQQQQAAPQQQPFSNPPQQQQPFSQPAQQAAPQQQAYGQQPSAQPAQQAAPQQQYAQQPYGQQPYNQQGMVVGQDQVYPVSSNDHTLRLIAFIFNIVALACIVISAFGTMGVTLIMLAWTIPMTVRSYNIYQGKKPNTIAFGVCELIFVSVVAGILLLVSHHDKA